MLLFLRSVRIEKTNKKEHDGKLERLNDVFKIVSGCCEWWVGVIVIGSHDDRTNIGKIDKEEIEWR